MKRLTCILIITLSAVSGLFAQDYEIPSNEWFMIRTAIADGKKNGEGFWSTTKRSESVRFYNKGNNNTKNQWWKFVKQSDGTYIIYSKKNSPNGALSLSRRNVRKYTGLKVKDKNKNKPVRWNLEYVKDGKFKFLYKGITKFALYSGKMTNGTSVTFGKNYGESDYQTYVLVDNRGKKYLPKRKLPKKVLAKDAYSLIPNKWFMVRSFSEDGNRNNFKGCWHVPDQKNRKEVSLHDSSLKDGNGRWWKFEKQKDGKYIIYSKIKNHAAVLQRSRLYSGNKLKITDLTINKPYKWTLKHLGNGIFKFFAARNYALYSRNTKNGHCVSLWPEHELNHRLKWVLLDNNGNKFVPAISSSELSSKIKKNMSKTGVYQQIPDKWFGVQSAMQAPVYTVKKGCWDVEGNPRKRKTLDIETYAWKKFHKPDSQFKFEKQKNGRYYIYTKVGYPRNVCEVARSGSGNGVDFRIARKSGRPQQLFDVFHVGSGRFRVISHDGYVVCIKDQSLDNEKNIHMWKNHAGAWTEWYLYDARSTRVFRPAPMPSDLSHIKPEKSTGAEANRMFAEFDRAYKEAYKAWKDVANLSGKTNSISSTLKKKEVIEEKLAKMEDDTRSAARSLLAVKRIPVIGVAAKPLRLTLSSTADKIEKISAKVERYDRKVMTPVTDNADKLNNSTVISEQNLFAIIENIVILKMQTAAKCNCIVRSGNSSSKRKFEKGSAKLSRILSAYRKGFSSINKVSGNVEKLDKSVSRVKPAFNKAVDGTKKFIKEFKKTQKAVDDVNKVLDKKFRKKVLGKQISVSLRDVLNGGGAFKKAKELLKKAKIDLDKWAKKALKPVTKKLSKKMPRLPNLDKYYENVNSLKSSTNKMKNTANVVARYKKTVEKFKKLLQSTADKHLLNIYCKD